MGRNTRVLVIDSEPALIGRLEPFLVACGYEVETASTGEAGIARFRQLAFDVVVTGLQLPDMQSFEVLDQVKKADATTEVIITTHYASVPRAIEAVKAGAFYFLEKPFEPERLPILIERALAGRAERPRDTASGRDGYTEIIGRSKPIRDMLDVIAQVAKSDANILILGESGTGKELIANAIHYNSLRATRDFVKINCAALPRELIENELFGHARGAFTGAEREKEGLIGSADGGSLLLDEIAEMPVELQPKLLRVLQERQYLPLGSDRTRKVDFRLIASTNHQPHRAVRDGLLREDLYYRIATITITVPPLRERAEDIPLLAGHMLERFAKKYKKPIAGFSSAAATAMCDYAWPGNVRELENAIERAVLLTRGPTVGVADLPLIARGGERPGAPAREAQTAAVPAPYVAASSDERQSSPETSVSFSVHLGMTLAQIERDAIAQTLRHTNGNKTAAADALGIDRPRLYGMIRKYHLTEFMPEAKTPRERRRSSSETENAGNSAQGREVSAVAPTEPPETSTPIRRHVVA
jgi:DNA-binding NtrC family response regulator